MDSKSIARKRLWVRVPPAALTMTWPPEEVARVRQLDSQGLNRCQIARVTGIPRRTISGWLNGHAPAPKKRCFRCDACKGPFPCLLDHAYSYLLGVYLGDSCILRHHRGVHELRIALDDRYPVVVQEIMAAMTLVMPVSKATPRKRPGERCVEVKSYSKHWPCIFPQHGPGRKHERAIKLEGWQRSVCDLHPWPLLRGLIHSDRCRFVNTIRHPQRPTAIPATTSRITRTTSVPFLRVLRQSGRRVAADEPLE